MCQVCVKEWIVGWPVLGEVCEVCQVMVKCVSSLCQVCQVCVKCESSGCQMWQEVVKCVKCM